MTPDLIQQGTRRVLPQGEHPVSWDELKALFGVGSFKRKQLMEPLLAVARMLHSAGCVAFYVDGSLTTDKKLPGDWDGCFCTAGLDWTKVDRALRTAAEDASRKIIKRRYKADLFAADCLEGRSGLTFREFFQQDDQGRAKGIVLLDLGSLP